VRENRKRALRLASENAALKEALAADGLAFASRLVAASDLRDGRCAAHAAAASVYAGDTARELGLGEGRAEEVRLAALLIDVGHLFVPDEVLLTPQEKLNSLGRARLEGHPVKGEEILQTVPGLPAEAARWVRWHHERADGTGYPDRLRGNWIPQEARILAVASHYASLILDGPHAPALTPSGARREMVAGIGGAFDGDVVAALLRVLDTEDAPYASASDDRFTFRSANRWGSLSPATTEDPIRL
jgi:HD-GYP domain-containing protein (c-di-GMP phosphodiesterase class II)